MSEESRSKENQSNYEEKSFDNIKKKIRNNWKSLIYNSIRGTITNLGAMVAAIVFLKKWFWVAVIILILLEFIHAILKWNYEYLVLEENEARYYKGILSKQTLIIPEKSFKSMDLSQNLVERILGYKRVKIESPSKDLGTEEIKLYLNDEEIKLLKAFALGEKNKLNREVSLENTMESQNENKEEQLEVDNGFNSSNNVSIHINREQSDLKEKSSLNYKNDSLKDKKNMDLEEKQNDLKEKKASNKELLLYGFTSFNLFVAIFFIFNLWQMLGQFMSDEYMNNLIGGAIKDRVTGLSVILIIISIIALLIILKLIASIYYFVKYYNFKIEKENNNIKIKYGFFNTKEFSFKENNIKLVKIRSNPLRQLLKKYEINLVVKGYSGGGDDRIIMYPIASKEETQNIIKEFIPEWAFDEEVEGIKYGRLAMIIKPVITMFIISLIAYLIFKSNWMFIINIISLITIPNAILKGKNIGLKVGEKMVEARNGGLLRTIYILRGKDIQAISFTTNPIQNRNNIGKLTLDYYSEVSAEINLPYMKECYTKKLLKISKGK